jgi:hypothetical protein
MAMEMTISLFVLEYVSASGKWRQKSSISTRNPWPISPKFVENGIGPSVDLGESCHFYGFHGTWKLHQLFLQQYDDDCHHAKIMERHTKLIYLFHNETTSLYPTNKSGVLNHS